jgi:SOS regulatory protein LexA
MPNRDTYERYKDKLRAFYKRHRRMPGYGELMQMTGFRSKNAVWKLIQKFVEDGLVDKDAEGRIIPKNIWGEAKLLGLVEAGFPSPAEEELLDTMSFDEYLTPNKESSYILRVKGESMREAGIRDGDMVVVERRQTYKPGQIVVAALDGEYTMKYLRKAHAGYYLEPANPEFKPIYPKEGETLSIEAVVTAVVRKY